MIPGRVVCVHSLAQARMALACGYARGRAVVLLSGQDAASVGGCGWWRALVALAMEATGAPCRDLLDCGDGAGLAMAALRIGQLGLVLTAETPSFARVRAAAAVMGALVLPARPECLDLAAPGALRRLDAWISD